MKISSPAFKNGGKIPYKYSCEGENINPEIDIEHIPDGTASLALIIDDPDAPNGTWTHWILYNIPANTSVIPENASPGIRGISTSNQKEYVGPCPPGKAIHRYYFRLYALDTRIEKSDGLNREGIDREMMGHMLATAEIMGYYSRE